MAEERKGTEYVVLRRQNSEALAEALDTLSRHAQSGEANEALDVLQAALAQPAYIEAAPARAPNDVAAIKAAEKATGQKFDHGAVAIPSRSWRPRVPKDEMVPRRLWS